MQSRAVRMYGKNDLRVEELQLPELEDGELLLSVKASAICSSCSKIVSLGEDHHRVPNTVSTNPIILGHEFSAEIIKVSKCLENDYNVGDMCVVQPMLYREGGESLAVGHSFPYLGGYATCVKVPKWVVESGGVVVWEGLGSYKAALAEPLACIIAAWRSQYHTLQKSYKPVYGHRPSGKTLLLGGTGAMGYLTILLWQLRADIDATLVVYGRNEEKLATLTDLFCNDKRITVVGASIAKNELLALSGGDGFDDVVVFASSTPLIGLGLSILAYDGCLNMFSGPKDSEFTVPVNFHAVHYKRHHIVGSSGASEEDMRTAVQLLSSGGMDPSHLITHIGGLNAVPATVMSSVPHLSGKKLIYPHLDFPLTKLSEIENLVPFDKRFSTVDMLVKHNNGFWNVDAELELLNITKLNNQGN